MPSEKQLKYWESLRGKQPKNMEGLKLGRGWNKKEQKVEIVLCACGCGKELNKFDKKNRIRESLPGHLLKFVGGGFRKGHKTWNKGTKGLIVSWNKGESMKDYPQCGFQKGHKLGVGNNYSLGKKWTEEQKEKHSELAKKKGYGKWMEGKKLSDKTKTKILIKLKAWQLSKEPSSIEKIVYDFLLSKGVIFEKQKLINGKFLVDVYIPEFNLVIECDGKYWHSLERVVKKDKAENAYLTKCGYNLLRLSEDEINSGLFKQKMGVEN